MQSKAKTIGAYLKELPTDRRQAISAVRDVILKNLPKGYEESMQYGMIGYGVPLKLYPQGYLGDGKTPIGIAALASQKNYMSLYLIAVYGQPESENWFKKEYKATGKKLDMGKSCVRFKKLQDLPLDLVGKVIAKTSVSELIKMYESARSRRKA